MTKSQVNSFLDQWKESNELSDDVLCFPSSVCPVHFMPQLETRFRAECDRPLFHAPSHFEKQHVIDQSLTTGQVFSICARGRESRCRGACVVVGGGLRSIPIHTVWNFQMSAEQEREMRRREKQWRDRFAKSGPVEVMDDEIGWLDDVEEGADVKMDNVGQEEKNEGGEVLELMKEQREVGEKGDGYKWRDGEEREGESSSGEEEDESDDDDDDDDDNDDDDDDADDTAADADADADADDADDESDSDDDDNHVKDKKIGK